MQWHQLDFEKSESFLIELKEGAVLSEYVTVNECSRTREGMYKDLQRVDITLGAHGEENTDTKVILAKLTILQEIALRNISDLTQTVKEIDKRVLDRQNEEFQEAKEAKVRADQISIVEAERSPKFWETETGIWCIKVGVGVAVIVVLIALGQSIEPVINKFFGGAE